MIEINTFFYFSTKSAKYIQFKNMNSKYEVVGDLPNTNQSSKSININNVHKS